MWLKFNFSNIGFIIKYYIYTIQKLEWVRFFIVFERSLMLTKAAFIEEEITVKTLTL